MAHIHTVGQDLLNLCYSTFSYSVDIHELWSGTKAIEQGDLLISFRGLLNTLELYAHSGLCAFCWREFIGFLRGFVSQIYELLTIKYSIKFWLQKPAKILDAPPRRHHRNGLLKNHSYFYWNMKEHTRQVHTHLIYYLQ